MSEPKTVPIATLVDEIGDGAEAIGVATQSSYEATLTQLRAWLTRKNLPQNTRLPTERDLAERLGVSRGSLRKALATLEDEGHLWRHVGKGTFVGARAMDVLRLDEIDRNTSPQEVMRTRLLLEPVIAREAALNATRSHVDALRSCTSRMRSATSWRHYETADNELHRSIAEATGNTLLLALFDAMNAVRRAVVWGITRPDDRGPPASHHSFLEHDAIINAIEKRDYEAAQQAMLDHLRSVEQNLLRKTST